MELELEELGNRIKFMRNFKGWSQDKMAEGLDMAVSGYAKIEHGETDPSYKRLLQISKLLGISLSRLISLNEANVLNIIDNHNTHDNASIHSIIYSTVYSTVYSYNDADKFQQENEKLKFLLEQRNQEIHYLKEMLNLLKNKN